MVRIIIAWLFILQVQAAYSQDGPTGFYIVLPNQIPCRLTLPTLDKKQQLCVSEKPIIGVSEFQEVGELKYDTLHFYKYFNVKLSEKGFTTWKALLERLPKTNIALVSDNVVFAIFEKMEGTLLHTISISGPLNSVEIDLIYKKLKNKSPD